MKTSMSRLGTMATAAALMLSAVAALPAQAAPGGREGATSVETSSGATSVVEQRPTRIDAQLSVSGGPVKRAVVRIGAGASPQDRLLFTASRKIDGEVKGRRLLLTGAASASRYQRALRSVQFAHTGDSPAASRTIVFTVRPVEGKSARATKQLRVTALADNPQVATSSDVLAVQAGGPAVPLDAGIRVADVDSATLAGAMVSGSDDASLGFASRRNGITGSVDADSGDLELTGTASVAAYQAALRTVTYTADADAAPGQQTVEVEVVDQTGLVGAASRRVEITGDQTGAVVARDDAATVLEDATGAPIDVLGNDSAPAGSTLQVASVTQPTRGGAVFLFEEQVRYRPASNYCTVGTDRPADTFTYTLATGQAATVRVSIICVDDEPGAVDDTATVTEDDAATRIDVRANDTDRDGGQNGITAVTQPANGTVVRQSDAVTYRPNSNYCNTQQGGTPDTFTYTVNGGSTATVRVSVTCVDDPPVAQPDLATVTEDAAATAIPVLDNDGDIDGGHKSISATTPPANGTVVITGGGSGLTYKPNANYCNSEQGPPDTFTYTLAASNTTTVTVVVTCVDDAPVAVADSATAVEDGSVLINVVANDTDVDGGPTEVASVTPPGHGTATISSDKQSITYTPSPNYCNSGGSPDSFTYTLSGGNTTTVSAAVACVNDAPVAADFTFSSGSVPAGQAFTAGTGAGWVFAYVEDPDNADGELTVAGCDSSGAFTCATPAGGSFTVRANGSWTYTSPAAGLQSGGTDTFDFFVADPSGLTDSGRITVFKP